MPWWLQDRVGRPLVLMRREDWRPGGIQSHPVAPDELDTLLTSWLGDRAMRAQLARLFAELRGAPEPPTTWHAGDTKRTVGGFLSRMVVSGALVGFRLRETEHGLPAPGPNPSPRPPPPEPGRDKTFIDLALFDLEGAPMAGERYFLRLPDESERRGSLDRNGRARLTRLDPGMCSISFPDIDAREWGPSGNLPALGQEGEGVAKWHAASDTDWVGRIAAANGFRDERTLWLHPANADLRAKRSPDVLFRQDQVAIPIKIVKEESGETGRSHRFVARVRHHMLQVRVHDYDGEPLANHSYTLEVDGEVVVSTAVTSADGLVEQRVSATARAARVVVGQYGWDLAIGALNPLRDVDDEGISGAQARLNNLGYDPGPIDGVFGPRTAAAVRWFQRERSLRLTGGLDDATRAALYAALESAHGS